MSIRKKLTIIFLAITSLPLLFVSYLTYNSYKNSLETNRLSQLRDLTVFRAESIETYFAGIKSHIEMAQGFYDIKKNLPVLTRFANDPNNPEFHAAKKMLDGQLQQMQSVSDLPDIRLVNPQGKVVYTSSNSVHLFKEMSNGNDIEQKAFNQGKDSVYFSDVYFDKTEDNKFEMLLTAPASDFNGVFIGVIAFEVDMTPVYKLMQDTTGLGKTGEVLVGRKIGNQVEYLNPLRHEPNTVMKRINIGEKIGNPIQEAVQGRNGVGVGFDYRGRKVIAAWRYIPSLNWGLVAKIDTAEAFADVTNLRNLSIIILIIIFALAGIVAFSIAKSISKPIKQLSEGVQIVGSGNLDYKIGLNLKDEIGQLSRSFDKMTHDLKLTTASRDELNTEIEERKQVEEALRQAHDQLEMRVQERTKELTAEIAERKKAEKTVKAERKRFEDVLEMMPAYAVLLKPDYHVAFANRTFREWFGDDNGKKCYEFLFNRTEPCENCQTYDVLKTGKSQFWEWTGPNGHNYDIYDYPFTDTDGSALIMEIGLDVTAHKQAQEALRSASLYSRGLIEASLDPLVTISPNGKITDVNKATEAATGLPRETLIGSEFSNYFTEPQKAKEVYENVLSEGQVRDYPLRIRHKSGRIIDVLYNAVVYKNEAGEIQGIFAAARDVTKHKAAERKQGITNSLLELFAAKTLRKEYLDATTKVIRDWSGCEFIGIRIKDNDGNIPYESYVGFEQNFLELENCLNLGRDNCVCVQAILQNYPQREYITSAKSFFCNDSKAFLKSFADQQKKNYRGNCMKFGFQSIAVVPIRYHNEIFGAIHIADLNKDMVSLSKVQFIESTVAPLIGEAVNRFNAEAELRRHRLHLEDIVKQRTQELRESEDDLNRAQAVAHIGSWRMDVQQNVLTWSDETHRIFGIPKGTLMTYETFLSNIHPDDRKQVDQKWIDALKGEPYDIEHRIIVDGQIKWVRERADLELDKNGVLLGGFGTTEDITDRKNYEEQINDLAKFPSESPHPILRIEDSGKIVYANNSGVELLKFWRSKLGQNVPADWQELINEALKTRQNIIKETLLNNSVVSFAITPIHGSGYVNIYGRDITEYKTAEKKLQEINSELETRVRQRTKQLQEMVAALQNEVLDRIKAENDLLENQDKLRLMSQELVLAEERERRELAVQLHDSIGQLLSFSKKELGALSRNAPETLKSSLEKIWELIKQAVEQTRTLTFDLSSATLYTIGLEAAIEELAEDFAKDHVFKLHFNNDANQKSLTEQFKVLLYRAVRELLINISKHSKAHNVYIDIQRIKDSICIIVKDDGIGFDTTELESKKGKLKGFGLFSLQERLVNIGGSIDIKSQPRQGMTVTLTAPLAESKGK